MRHRCDIFRVAEQCGIRLLRPADHRPLRRRPRECFAKKTLKKIGQRNGEAHLALALRVIVETRDNATELYSETIQAVSALLEDPAIEGRGGALFDQFDQIALAEVRRDARALGLRLPLAHVMRVMIAMRLRDATAIDTIPQERGNAA